MNTNDWLMIAIFIIGAGAIIGFFITKTAGFGRFTTSVLLILIVITIGSLLHVGGKLDSQIMANILFAVFGFAGGLFTSKDSVR